MANPIIVTGLSGPAPRLGSSTPTHYRLARKSGWDRPEGLILQGWFTWTAGEQCGGEWLDIPFAEDANDKTPPGSALPLPTTEPQP